MEDICICGHHEDDHNEDTGTCLICICEQFRVEGREEEPEDDDWE